MMLGASQARPVLAEPRAPDLPVSGAAREVNDVHAQLNRTTVGRVIEVDSVSALQSDWQRLLLPAHADKARAFAEYARHYLSTDGHLYWSDTDQLSSYIDGYHAAIDQQLGASVKGSEMISELYVPRTDLPAFMFAVREDARRHDVNIIYGTIRLIEKDDESVLAWAREPWACTVFNLHVDLNQAPRGEQS